MSTAVLEKLLAQYDEVVAHIQAIETHLGFHADKVIGAVKAEVKTIEAEGESLLHKVEDFLHISHAADPAPAPATEAAAPAPAAAVPETPSTGA
jgi:hypothetical protein